MLYNRVEENYFVWTNCISDIQFDTGGGAGKGKRRGRTSSERAQKKSKPKENNVKWQLSQKAGISDSRSPVAVLVSVATS